MKEEVGVVVVVEMKKGVGCGEGFDEVKNEVKKD